MFDNKSGASTRIVLTFIISDTTNLPVVAARAFNNEDNGGTSADGAYRYTFTFSHILRTDTLDGAYVYLILKCFSLNVNLIYKNSPDSLLCMEKKEAATLLELSIMFYCL